MRIQCGTWCFGIPKVLLKAEKSKEFGVEPFESEMGYGQRFFYCLHCLLFVSLLLPSWQAWRFQRAALEEGPNEGDSGVIGTCTLAMQQAGVVIFFETASWFWGENIASKIMVPSVVLCQ